MADIFPEHVGTDRLDLTALTTDFDTFDLYEHVRVGAPHIDEVTEYLTWCPHETPKETQEFIDNVTDVYEDGEGVTYVIRPRDGEDGAGEFAGLAGLHVAWEAKRATFGTWLRKRFWGRGYSGDRAGALMRVVFETLDLETVVVTVHRGNEKSRSAVSRYVEAHGGRHEGLMRNYQTDQDGTPVDGHRYSVTREEYESATAE